MAETRIADVVVPEVLSDMVSAQISNYIDFVKLGIATKDYGNADIKDGGHFAKVPFYDQLTGDDEILSDSADLTVGAISTGTDIGVVCHRGRAWGSRDLAAILSGDDPMKEISKQVASYWGKRFGVAMINVLNGVFGTALASTHVSDVAADDTTAVTITASSVIGACAKLGDAMDEFDAIVVHSKVYADMLRANLVSFPERFGPDNLVVNGDRGKYLGLDIVVSDYCPTSGTGTFTHYTSYLMKKGAMYFGFQRDIMTENDRDILAQKDFLATTAHFVPHVKLVKWNVTDTNPHNTSAQATAASDADNYLANPDNWSNVADDNKFIGTVALITNATQ